MSRLMNSRRTSYDVHFPFITLQLLDKIRTVLGEFPDIQYAWIFGMHALGSAKPTSDIDIALSGDLDHKVVLRINSILQQKLSISRKTSCVHYETSETILKEHIEHHGVRFYSPEGAVAQPHLKQKKKKIIL